MDKPGRQWNGFQANKRLTAQYSFANFACKILVVSLIAGCYFAWDTVSLVPQKVASVVSDASSDVTVRGLSTLACNINNDRNVQCLVDMQPDSPTDKHCVTDAALEHFERCGALFQSPHTYTYIVIT